MKRLVLKFGGTSVGTIEKIQKVANIIKKRQEEGHEIIVVVSAMHGTTDDVKKIVNSKSAILIDTWKQDIKPEKLDPKKWMPVQRYSIPGAKWLPNVGLETLTPELRNYFEVTVERLTKGDKDKKIVSFCRRGYYSKIAAERLVKMGYTNVLLYPGTDLWEDAGNRLIIVKPEIVK